MFYWDRVAYLVLSPILILLLVVCGYNEIKSQYLNYLEVQGQERMIQESITLESERKAHEQYLKESYAKREQEAREKTITDLVRNKNQAELEQEDKIAKKVCPNGTYIKDINTKQIGQVKNHYGFTIITDNDKVQFEITPNGEIPENITFISYKEYKTFIENEINNKKLTDKEIQQRQEALKKIREQDTKETEKIWHIEDCFTLNGAMYQVREIKGTTLICYKAHTGIKSQKRFQFEVYAYDEGIERMSWHDFISKS